jgi:DNA-binding XRE family transcriptional regulator
LTRKHKECIDIFVIEKSLYDTDAQNLFARQAVAKSARNGGDKVSPPNPIGRRRRQLRKAHDWTLAEVAGRRGISVGTLSRMEHGKTDLNFTSVNSIVNVNAIVSAESHLNGEYLLTLEVGARLKVSRSYRDRIRSMLGN